MFLILKLLKMIVDAYIKEDSLVYECPDCCSEITVSDKDKETLAATEVARIQKKVEARQKENPKYKLDNIKAQFITIGGENCLNVSFDLSSSTEMDYIFVRDGKFISFDYQYPFDDAKRQKAAVVKSAKSIRFNP